MLGSGMFADWNRVSYISKRMSKQRGKWGSPIRTKTPRLIGSSKHRNGNINSASVHSEGLFDCDPIRNDWDGRVMFFSFFTVYISQKFRQALDCDTAI